MKRWYEEDTADFYFDEVEAERFEKFFPTFLTHVKGDLGGQPLELMDWVRHDLIRPLFGVKRREDDKRRFRTVYCEVPRKNAKALALDTPIATPFGWSTIGELQEGDLVFDPEGNQVKVTAVSKIFLKPCYLLKFQNADPIVASEDHEWVVIDRNTNQGVRTYSTRFLYENQITGGRGDRRFRVGLNQPLVCEQKKLPIPPYTLGVWLGDGYSDGARLIFHNKDREILNYLRAENTPTKVTKQSDGCLRVSLSAGRGKKGSVHTRLRTLDLLGNKHIPEQYLWASKDQRLELLRGLMDTDGTCSKAGQCSFSSTNWALAQGVLHLVTSLGIKASIKTEVAKLKGRVVGDSHRVTFFAFSNESVFKLRRKAERLRAFPVDQIKRKGTGFYQTSTRSQVRSLESIERYLTIPTRCISVDSPSRCFLAGRSLIPTHNTTIAAGIALAVLFLDQEYGAEIYSAAADREQASICFSIAQQMVANNPILNKRCKTYRNKLVTPGNGSSYRSISAEAHTKHGFNAHCIIFDELHSQPNRDLWDVLCTSTGSRSQPILFAITTSGFDKQSICYEIHTYAKRVMSGDVKDDTFLPVIYGADLTDDWKSPEVWAKANPGLGISVREDYIRGKCNSAQEVPSEENTFKRLHLNIWTEQETRWLPMDTWNKCVGKVDLGELERKPCWLGLDLSSTQDLTALVLVFDIEGKIKVLPFFWIPEEGIHRRSRRDKVPYDGWKNQGLLQSNPGGVIDYARIRRKIHELAEIYDIQEIAIDKWGAQNIMTELDNDGFVVVPMSPQMSPMSGPTKELERLVLGGKLEHGNNPIMNWCAANISVKTNADGQIKPDRETSVEKIDGIVALILAISRWMVQADPISVYTDRGLRTL